MNIYPDLPGLSYPVTRRPIFKNLKHESVTGRVVTATYMQYPLYEFDLSYDYLSAADRASLIGFFLEQGGDLSPFYFDAGPGDDSVTKQAIGTGDGATKTFNLLRGLGNFSEPIPASFGSPIVYTPGYGGDGVENLLTYSQQFANAAWVSPSAVPTDNVTASPDGSTTASSLIEDTSISVGHWIDRSVANLSAGQAYEFSVYSKPGPGSKRYLQLVLGGAGVSSTIFSCFDVAAGTAVASSGATVKITKDGSYYKCSVSATVDLGGSVTLYARLSDTYQAAYSAYTGDGISGLYIWGASLGRYGTQGYIATTATPYTWSVPANGTQVTFAIAPANGAAISWSGNYYYQCRFLQGVQQYDEFVNLLYNAKSVMLRTYR